MTDWTKQTEELMKTWMKAQQQFWDTWKAALPKVGTTQATQIWAQMADVWKEAVEQAAHTQIEWATMWADSIRAQESAPKELKAWSDQLAATMKTWTESQAQLWESILDAMKQSTPDQFVQRLDEGTQVAFQSWQEAVEKAAEAQRKLVRLWGSGTGGEKA